MIQLKQLEKARREAALKFAAAKNLYEAKTAKYKAELERKVDLINVKYEAICNQYFDENLRDCDEQPVKIGDVLTYGGSVKFKVKKRHLAADYNGEISYPFIVCSKPNEPKSKDVNLTATDIRCFKIKAKEV
jgi:hypothetical protein